MRTTSDDLYQLIKSVTEDFEYVSKLSYSEDNQYTRRFVYRSFFSMVDSTIFLLKQKALYYYELQYKKNNDYSAYCAVKGVHFDLSDEELALLRDEQYELTDQGNARVGEVKLNLKKNLQFSFKMSAKSVFSNFQLDKGGQGWELFFEANKIRNRITHPKSKGDLIISDEDFEKLKKALDWYTQIGNKLSEMSDYYSWVNDVKDNNKYFAVIHESG